jgi:hypothetical protein
MAKSNATQISLQQPQAIRFRMPRVGGAENDGLLTNDPSQWFADKFPDLVQQYGPAFLECTYTDMDCQAIHSCLP